MCFFGSNKSSAPVVAQPAPVANMNPPDMTAQADEQRRRVAAANTNTQGMADNAMTSPAAGGAGKTVLGA